MVPAKELVVELVVAHRPDEAVTRVLSIAGSDPSGGAGIQADLKTFAALGAYGMAALTSLTAQNTCGVRKVCPVPAGFVREQLDAVFDDIDVDAVKIGMLNSAAAAAVIADVLAERKPPVVVLDPVMVATSGHRLLDAEAADIMRERLVPLADLVTPNISEAALLLQRPPAADLAQLAEQASALVEAGARAALVTGGHLGGVTSPDVLVAVGEASRTFAAARVETPNTHGTGCTLSAALAALRPTSHDWCETVLAAKDYLGAALTGGIGLGVGRGNGPLWHGARV